MNRSSSILAFGACTLVVAAAYADDAAPKWAPWIDAEWNPGTHRSIGQFDAFAPIMQDEASLLFVNPRMRFDDQDSQEYNWGLGYRRMVDKDWIVGGYTYVDRTVSGFSNHFQEVTLGLEALSEDWKFRINDYQPFGKRSYSGQNAQAVATGGNIQIQSNTERSMQGDDIEAGYRVPMNDANAPDQLWVYAGGYRFSAPTMRTVEGPRARFEYEIGDVTVADRNLRLRLSGEVQHDNVRSTQWFAGIRIGIPLGDEGVTQYTSKLTPMERHMIDPVRRDVDIVTATGDTKTENAINTYNDQPVSGVTTIDANTSNIATAVTAAGGNSVVVFDGSAGTITLPTSTSINMVNGQTLLGGGSSLLLRGANSGLSAVYYPRGSIPTLNGNVSSSIVNLASNGVMKGFNASNTGNAGVISTNGASHYTVADNAITVSHVGSSGIYASNSNGTVSNNTITATSGAFNSYGIYAVNAGTLTISGNIINFTAPIGFGGAYGIFIAATSQAAINSNAIYIDSGIAIAVGSSPSTSITNNALQLSSTNRFNTSRGIEISAHSNGAVIDRNTITNNDPYTGNVIGINSSSNISVNDNTIVGQLNSLAAMTFVGATGVSGKGNAYGGMHHCSASSSSGSIGFVDGRHCP